MMKKRHTRGQRGLVDADLVEAALAEIERGGLEGLQPALRGTGYRMRCRDLELSLWIEAGIERAVADRLHGEIKAPGRRQTWQRRFTGMAIGYHDLARRYPNAFPLLLRFWTSGPRDLELAEEWHQALYDAGVPEKDIPAVGYATYAAILGICSAEIGGLVGKPNAASLAEVESQADLLLTKRLLPIFEKLDEQDVFDAAIKNLVAGIESMAKASSRSPARR